MMLSFKSELSARERANSRETCLNALGWPLVGVPNRPQIATSRFRTESGFESPPAAAGAAAEAAAMVDAALKRVINLVAPK